LNKYVICQYFTVETLKKGDQDRIGKNTVIGETA